MLESSVFTPEHATAESIEKALHCLMLLVQFRQIGRMLMGTHCCLRQLLEEHCQFASTYWSWVAILTHKESFCAVHSGEQPS